MSNKQIGRPKSELPRLLIQVKTMDGKTHSKQFRTTSKFENVVEVVEKYLETLKL
jgi:hypothetical protein